MTFREADELRERHTAAVHPGVRATKLVPEPVLGVENILAVLRSCEPLLLGTMFAALDRALEKTE